MIYHVFRSKLLVSICALGLMAWLLSGCASQPSTAATATSGSSTNLQSTALVSQASGAQLWARNCGHCHNIRSPTSYSGAQWEVAVMHMRIRANLTAEEHAKILAFLKSAH